MTHRPLNRRRAAELLRRHGVIAGLAALVIVGFAALAAIGAIDRRADETRSARQAVAATDDAARALRDRQQRSLDMLAAIAASSAAADAQQLLDQIPSLAPQIRGAAVYDPAGFLRRGAGELSGGALAALGVAAAKDIAAGSGDAPYEIRGGDGSVIGLARPSQAADGDVTGIALIAIETPSIAAEPHPVSTPLGAWPFVACAVIGVTAVLTLIAVIGGRLRAAEREIARRARRERDLRAELESAEATADRTGEVSRAKSQFFAQVTHELRTPLNAILGFSETIRQEMFGPVVNARYLEYAGLIHDAGAHLLSLINDLLDNARIEAGKMEVAPMRVSAAAVARSALDLVGLLAESRDIKIATTGLGGCPDLNVDPRALKQVLVNLLSNAIKYTPAGGRIDMRFAARDDGGVKIEVADTGIGMSAEDLRVAFDPFGRANAIEARRQQGTGLGLSLARSLVRLHGGDVTLTSRLEAGTTATVILPPGAAFVPTGPRLVLPASQSDAAAA